MLRSLLAPQLIPYLIAFLGTNSQKNHKHFNPMIFHFSSPYEFGACVPVPHVTRSLTPEDFGTASFSRSVTFIKVTSDTRELSSYPACPRLTGTRNSWNLTGQCRPLNTKASQQTRRPKDVVIGGRQPETTEHVTLASKFQVRLMILSSFLFVFINLASPSTSWA